MTEINNYNAIVGILRQIWITGAEPISLHLQVIQRRKDGNKNALICEWFIESEKHLEFLFPAIKAICKEYSARCYINLNPKHHQDVLWNMLHITTKKIQFKNFFPFSIVSSAHDRSKEFSKLWIVDIDDLNVDITLLTEKINLCKSKFEQNVICTVPTKNGFHIITHPFNRTELDWPTKLEVKPKASTLLYCYI